MDHKVSISPHLSAKVPGIKLSCIECDVQFQALNSALWEKIRLKVDEISSRLKVEQISQIPTISASRKAYKACGKDPARYRLSAEALLRRVVNRNEIYQINNIVDVLNLVSISSGFSIGGYDSDKIEGDVTFSIGEKDEPYSGIGRGELNIENLPVFRDETGAFGTPTSDSERTAVNDTTKRFLMIIIDFGDSADLESTANDAAKWLEKYALASNIELKTIG